MKRLRGFPLVVVATAIAGIAGYLITWWVARQSGLAEYRVFAVFWAFMYLLIGSLSGIQQEFARATRPHGAPPAGAREHHARTFALTVSTGVILVILASAPAWVHSVFPTEGWAIVFPLAVGAGSYVFVATIFGTLYGISRWGAIALMIVIDPVLRLTALVVALVFTHDVILLAWLVAVPVPLTLIVLIPVLRKSLLAAPPIDVGLGRLVWNVARTVLAAAALSLMVSGFPLALGVTSHGAAASVGFLILLITLTRAPLIVTVMALQSFLIVRFRDHASTARRTLLILLGLLVACAIVLSALAWAVGPSIIAWLFPLDPKPDGLLLALLVGSSALVAAMCITAAAALAVSRHLVYSLGWIVAALATVAALLLPLPLEPRALVALTVGPAAGLVVHFVGMLGARTHNAAARESLPTEHML